MADKLKLEVVLSAIDKLTRPLKALTGGSRQLSGALRETRDSLKALDAQQSKITAFREAQKQASIASAALGAQQQKLKALKAEINATTAPSKALTRAFEDARKEAARLRAIHGEQTERMQRLRTALGEAGIDTKKLAEHQRQLKAATAGANEALKRQQADLERLNKAQARRIATQKQAEKLSRFSGRMAGAGAMMGLSGAATTGAVAAPVAAFAQAEDAATGLRAAMMNAQGQIPPTFNAINALATRLGDRLPGTTADYQNMMTMLIRQGMSAKAILGGLGEATAYLGVQLKMPMDQAAEFASKLQDATKTTERDMMGLMDVVQKTFNLGVDQNNMLEAMKGASLAMDIMRKDGLAGARVMAPLITMLDQAGMKGETSGNAIRKIFQMSMDASKVAKGAKEAGISLNFTDGKGEFGGLEKMFAQLDKLKGLSTGKRLSVIKTIFGDDKDTIEALNTITKKGIDGYREVQQKMAAQASLQQRVNEQLGTLKNLWDAASGTAINMLATFGATLAPDLKALVNWLGDAASAVREFSEAHPTLTKWIMRTAAVLGVLLLAASGVALAIAGIVGPFAMAYTALATFGGIGAIVSGAITMIGGAFSAVTGFLLANPIVLVIAGIALAALLIYKYWEPIKAFFLQCWSYIDGVFKEYTLLNYIFPFVGAVRAIVKHWSILGPFFNGLWSGIKSAFLNFTPLGLVITHWDAIKSAFLNFTPLGLIIANWGGIAVFFSRLWDGLVLVCKTAFGVLQTILRWDPMQTLSAFWADAKQAFSGGIAGIAALLLNWSPLNLMYRAWAGVFSWFGIDLPNRFTGFGGMLMDGLVKGITKGLSRVKSAIEGAGGTAIAGFMTKLGIHSPSRVFAELGHFTMLGLDQGLTRGQTAPLSTVMGLGRRVVAAGAAAMGAITAAPAGASGPVVATGGAAGSAHYEIHIHAAPGMDEKALARFVGEEIDRRERDRASRNRSRLHDYD